MGRTKARGWGLPAHLARSVPAAAEAAQVCVRPGGTAGRASTRPGEGGAGPGAGVPAQAPAGPWPPPASADSGEGVAPSSSGPGAPARPPPGLVSPPAVPPSVFLHLPLSSFHFAAAASPLSRPPFSLRFPAARRRPLPLGDSTSSPPLQAGGPSGGTSLGCLVFSLLATMASLALNRPQAVWERPRLQAWAFSRWAGSGRGGLPAKIGRAHV